MLEDAILALTNRGDIVIDPFLRSDLTLIAADKPGTPQPRRRARLAVR
jgi:DNA modification methylase